MPTETPVIKQNAYPYNNVTNKQAQNLASSEHFAVEGYETSLMFGVQWDLILKYMETKAVEKGANQNTIISELNSDSTNWGNYYNNNWTIENSDMKYYYRSEWNNGLYNGNGKKGNTDILLSTGADDDFSKQNIYDIAGNVYEWTLEYTSSTSLPCATRGGYYYYYGSNYPASSRSYFYTTGCSTYGGFRLSLYKDVALDPDSDAPGGGSGANPGGGTQTPVIVDVVDPLIQVENINKNAGTVTADIVITDKYFDAANSVITEEDIIVYIDGQEATTLGIPKVSLSEGTALKEDRDGDGTEETQYGTKYTITINNLEEIARQATKGYKDNSIRKRYH